MTPPKTSFNKEELELLKLYDLITERYLEGTSRFHNVTNYFLVAESFVFAFYGQVSKDNFLVTILFPIVGFIFSFLWFLVLYRIEYVRDLRKRQGKEIEKILDQLFKTKFYLFRKEEYDINIEKGRSSSNFKRILQHLQVSHLVYGIPILFSLAWLVIFILESGLFRNFLYYINDLFSLD